MMLQAAAACSSKSPSASSAADSGAPASDGGIDGGASKYPAFVPDVGLLTNRGGPQLTSPRLVTVTWSADPNGAAFEDFDDKLGGSTYWAALKEYGVGPATGGSANDVRIGAAPVATIDVLDLETWLVQQVQDPATSGWPAYDPQTLYVVWVPTATNLTAGGVDACTGDQGTYHSEVMVGSSNVPYVFVDEACNGSQPLVDVATATGGHAIAEAVTDPLLYSSPAVVGFDSPHIAWQAWQGNTAEVADICVHFSDAFFKGPASLPYSIQRLWSNASAKAGHSPCVPTTSDPYYNVAPQNLEMLSTVVLGTATKAVKGLGYDVPVGTTKTVDVGYFSDAPLSAPITLTAVEGDGFTAPAVSVLSLSVGTGSGRNGDRDTVSVTMKGGNAPGNAFLMTLVTSAPGLPRHYMPVLIEAL